jgi:hypothetical protein
MNETFCYLFIHLRGFFLPNIAKLDCTNVQYRYMHYNFSFMFKTPEETSMTDDWAQFHQQELEKQKVGLSEPSSVYSVDGWLSWWRACLLLQNSGFESRHLSTIQKWAT